jgi:hypothetical protein
MPSYFLFYRKLDIKTFTANSVLSGFEILSLTVKYEYELQECKNKILLRTHKDSLQKTCI